MTSKQTGAGETAIKWDNVSVRVDKWKRLQALCEELEPHEHYEGMNECSICDEPLTDVLIRHCETLLATRSELAETSTDAQYLRDLETDLAKVIVESPTELQRLTGEKNG